MRRPPTTHALRAGLYYRVSSEEQVDGYSLDAEARAIKAYCSLHGWEMTREYRDEGKSARADDLAKRPAFAAMLADADAGLIDVIVVHKLDRFSRNVKVTFETLDRLQANGIAFASITENLDLTNAAGRATLGVLAVFAQFYSDNLSHETKKGKAERKAQGMYNGLLPFGIKKNSTGIPVPDPATYPGLLIAFQAAAEGKSDREVAVLLNERGYRTTGNRGANPFTKDTVRPLLQNRFYLGELPDGVGGWLPGKHEAVLDDALFLAAQATREQRVRQPLPVRRQARVYSLSGLLTCHYCGGTLHLHQDRGRARAYCYKGRQGTKCPQRSTFLDTYAGQILDHLASFTIPADVREHLATMKTSAQAGIEDADTQRRRLETQLANIRTLFELGDISKAEYLTRRDQIQRSLDALHGQDSQEHVIEQAIAFLSDLPAAWRAATDEQRNQMARLLFEEVRVIDEWVVAVKPQPTFAPFFDLDCQARRLSSGSDGIRTRDLSLDRAAC